MVPKISVILPYYNARVYLKEAVDSILEQTFTDLELILIDDGSDDGSSQIVEPIVDKRIVRMKNETNLGLADSLNRGIDIARGEFIARMDADDISLPSRLKAQIDYMEKNPAVGILSTAYREIDQKGSVVGRQANPKNHNLIAWMFLFGNPIMHPGVLMRRDCVVEVGGYQLKGPAQDRELWLRLLGKTKFVNLPEELYIKRYHSASVTAGRRRQRRAKQLRFDETDIRLKQHYAQMLLNRDVPSALIETLTQSQRPKLTPLDGLSEETLKENISLLYKLLTAFVSSPYIDSSDTLDEVRQDFILRLMKISRYSPRTIQLGELTKSWQSPFWRRALISLKTIAGFAGIWPEEWD